MAATCVARPTESCRPKTQKSRTGWAENEYRNLNRQFLAADKGRDADTYPSRIGGRWRYLVHAYTANSSLTLPPTTITARSTNSTPISRSTHLSTDRDLHSRAFVLVAELLYSIATTPAAYGTLPLGYHDGDTSNDLLDDQSLARACIVTDASAPLALSHKAGSPSSHSPSARNMDFGFDWGGAGGFQTRGKKKKAATPANKFDAFGDNNDEKKDDAGANGSGGDDGLGGSGNGGASGAGGGDDNNNGGGDDDDTWGFSTGKKAKKKTKKQLEEEEEERKRKEEEEAQAASNTNALSWADDTNDANANEDWTMSWGGAKTKDKKTKKKGDAPPAVPDAPSATSAFQDISLDDGAPKLDFTFDNLGDTKKQESGSGFGTWGKTWDFGSIGKEEKKEEPSDFGSSNPWGFGGSKTKKKTTTSSFDFGTDFGASGTNDLSFDANNDAAADDKPADDAWNFGGTGKKDKKKKVVEEIKEEPEPEQKEDTWGTWGTKSTTKKTTTTSTKKKNAFDDAFALTEEQPSTNGDASFDWGFGKDKTKDLISEVDEKPNDDGDDLMSGTWGAVGKKKSSKKTTNDFSTSFDLTSNNVTTDEPATDLWSTFGGSKKTTKSTKNILDEFLVEEPEPVKEPEAPKEPLVAWDFGLNVKDRKKKQKTMEKEGTWEARITQEMVEEEEARLAANPDPEPEPEPEPEQEAEPAAERVPWDHGLDAKARRKLQKEMQIAGTWADRLTQEKIDEEKRAAEEAAAAQWTKEPDPEPYDEAPFEPEVQEDITPLEDLVPWDHGLSPKEKKRKEKQMRLDGEWENRLTQEQIDEKRDAAAAKEAEAAASIPEPEPEPIPEPEPEPEADKTPLEDLKPWDYGLTPVRKKKMEKQMKLDGTWDDRLTQEKIDEMIAAAAAKAESAKEPEPEPIPELEPEPEPEPLEEKFPWDYGLTPKEKKKKEKEMIKNGTWDNRLTQEKIDEELATAAAKKAEQEVEPEALLEPEPEPEPEVVEERKPWDHGLSKLEKKRMEKQMKLDGTWEDRLTQEKIDEDAAAAEAAKYSIEPEPEEPPPPPAEPRLPWDHGLTPKEKKKKEKEMKMNFTWEDRLTQEMIDEEEAQAAAKAAEPEPEVEPEPAAEDAGGWGFGGWGAAKTKTTKKKSLLDPEPTPVEEKADEGWGGSWGLGFGKDKDKKKKKDELAPEPEAEPEPEPIKEKKDDTWNYATPATTSAAKKKKDKGAKKSETFDSFMEEAAPDPEPIPEPAPAAEDDLWAQFSKPAGKSTTTTKKSKKGEEAPPPAPSPPDLGASAEADEVADIPSVDDFNWGGLDNGRKSTKSVAADPPPKKSSSSLWGFGSTPTSSTPKTKKEKEAKAKKDAEEKAQKEEEERIQRENEEAEADAKAEADRLAEEEAAKAAKKTTKAGKLSKTSKTVEDKKKSSDLLDLLDEPVPTPASSLKLKKTPTRSSADKIEEEAAAEKEEATDYFSFWGATSNAKKVAGKKTPEAKKETKTPVLSNEEDALLAELNEDEIQAILDDAPAPASPKLSRTMSSSKSARSSINNRINSFDGKPESTGKTPKSSETKLSKEPEAEATLTPKETKKATKSKSSARSSKVQFEAPPSPEPEPVELKKSKESVPGSFPGGFDDDDAMLTTEEPGPDPTSDAEPTPVKSKGKKSTKVEKKVTKATPKKKKVVEEDPVDVVAVPDELDLLDDPPKLPTPPPEDDSKPTKPAKKERARVGRSATGSWALWGAQPTPKKPVRSKTMDDVSPPTSKTKSPPVMVRSKSSKTPKKDDLDDSKGTEPSKTSGSDKESSSKPSDKSKPSRGLTFSSFMMGTAPPSAMRPSNPTRRNSTTGSKNDPATPTRRQSVDYNAYMSPPPDENQISKGAAKLMGFAVGKPSRRSSVKGKSGSYPDPYPIDDDDMVMINTGSKDPEPSSRPKPRTRVSTGESKRIRSKTISGDEDVVMVDSPVAMESDFERPQLQRSNTSRSAKGFFGSLFSPAVKGPVERTRSAQVSENEESTPRVRSRNTSKRRSRVVSPADEVTTDAQGETDVDAARRRARRAAKQAEEDERQAREARRRERREREKADLEARQQRAREQARKEREAEEQRREERRARRKEKEAAERERLAQEEAEVQAAAERRREERRRRLEAEAAVGKDERRRTYAGDDDLKRRGERTKVKSSGGRRSTALMAEYHESRNGSGRGIKPPADKTSSWIDSQQDEPPELPPVEGTVLDESGQQPRPVDDADPRRRRKDKYAGMTEDEIARYRAKRRERRIVEKSTSGGSDEKQQQATPAKRSSKRMSRAYDDDYYADPVRTFDGRPQQTKRTSFLGKFF